MKRFSLLLLGTFTALSAIKAQQIPVYYSGSSYADCNLYSDTNVGAPSASNLNIGESGVDSGNSAAYLPFSITGSNVSAAQGAFSVILNVKLAANTSGTFNADLYGYPNRGSTFLAQTNDYSAGTCLATSVITGSSPAGWASFDVTDFVQQQIDAGNSAVVFKFKINQPGLPNADGAQTGYALYSADSGTSNAPYLQITVNRSDASTINNKVLCGYQGWFRCPGDPSNGWGHWSTSRSSLTGTNLNVDFWPDMSLYSPAEQYATPGLTYPTGTTASLFSSENSRTVLRHFQWMEQNGIDGVFLTWFVNYLPGGVHYPAGYADQQNVQSYVQSAAALTGRVWAVIYDASGTPGTNVDSIIENHWLSLVQSGVTSGPNYLHQNGCPVVEIYGFYDNDPSHQVGGTSVGSALINWFHANGVYVVGSGDWNWVTTGASDPAWLSMIESLDAYLPWNVGHAATAVTATGTTTVANTLTWQKDINTFPGKWIPCMYPGMSNQNEMLNSGQTPGAPIPRRQGQFLWEQFETLTSLNNWRNNTNTVFLAMFDEFDEGTGIMPATNTPPTQALRMQTYEGMPSDIYMQIAGTGGSYLRNGLTVANQSVVSPIEAASFNSATAGIATEACSEGGLNLGYLTNGAYTVYKCMNLNGVQCFEARLASAGAGGSIEVHLDSPTGPLVGLCSAPSTGGWQTWTNFFCPITGASGFHDVYLVYTGGTGYLFNLEWFGFSGNTEMNAATNFSGSSAGIGTQACTEGGYNVDYIKNGSYTYYNNINLAGMTALNVRVASAGAGGTISVCLDAPNGTVIGTVPVVNTGGWQTWVTRSCNLAATSGTHNLYLVYTGGSGYLFNVEWFALMGGINPKEAASFNSATSGIGTQSCSEGGLNIDYITNGSYTVYNDVDLTGLNNFIARVAASGGGGNQGGSIQIRLDSPTGTLIGTCPAPITGGWQTWLNESCSITPTTGFHNIYLVYIGGSGNLFNVENFQFAF